MAVISLPVLRLPGPALQKSLKQMSLIEQVSLSLLSNNAKRLITMLNEYHQRATIFLRTSSSIEVWLYTSLNQNFKFVLKADESTNNIEIRQLTNHRYESTMLNMSGLTLKQWVEHVVHVFFQEKGVILSLLNSTEICVEEIWHLLDGIKIAQLEIDPHQVQDCLVLKRFSFVEELSVSSRFPTPKLILTAGFKHLELHHVRVTLHDLLLLNCSHFTIFYSFPEKDLNLFLKQWIRGSNPRLQSFRYLFNNFNKARLAFLDGIYYIEIRDKKLINDRKCEIERYDGKKAVITVCSVWISMEC
ncbi:F-box domain-containing protein [Caenorhabditis elegans]|uniref:F-box domain-containing protein n=1 Tax=Caenorhabditis elegans TaxID=6239 RepID=P91538_CAEEL|nr:F-box domain-containing protein [Caenorhabditis elegans]CCD63689.1 F-box domain-containing protein [Caenorhabditis elegans]|eukprot:NP_494023.2 F-box B protein [Caenorhabditis elegans]